MNNWLRSIKNFFRNILWRNENEKIIIESKFPVEEEIKSIEITEEIKETLILTENKTDLENKSQSNDMIELKKQPQSKKKKIIKKKKKK